MYRTLGSLLMGAQPQTALTIPHHGMLGNTIAALAPRTALALHYKFDTILALGESVLSSPEIFNAAGTHRLAGFPTVTIGKPPKQSLHDVGTIVHFRKIPLSARPIATEHADGAWGLLSTVLLPETIGRCEPPETLVIHLRGGDVYAGSRPLPNHGQPPLAYYRFVMSQASWRKVLIVHQGAIPILEGLTALCAEFSIPLELQSLSLKQDVMTLLSASSLVVGRGSFAPAIVGLSRCAQNVYMFESGFGLSNAKSGVNIHRVVDEKGDYRRAVLSRNWERTQEQIDLMFSYPVENLALAITKD